MTGLTSEKPQCLIRQPAPPRVSVIATVPIGRNGKAAHGYGRFCQKQAEPRRKGRSDPRGQSDQGARLRHSRQCWQECGQTKDDAPCPPHPFQLVIHHAA